MIAEVCAYAQASHQVAAFFAIMCEFPVFMSAICLWIGGKCLQKSTIALPKVSEEEKNED